MKHVQLILGNQLFDPKTHFKHLDRSATIFMREDMSLCTHFKYHKQKISFFLSAMRKYALELAAEGYPVHYEQLDPNTAICFEKAFLDFLIKNKTQKVFCFEIEDKFFESRLLHLLKKAERKFEIRPSPMFLTTRDQFAAYLHQTKKPFMKNFYVTQRKRLGILIEADGTPVGGQWSFDEKNRKPLPKKYQPHDLPHYEPDPIDKKVFSLVENVFSEHPGSTDHAWLPTDRTTAQAWLMSFLNDRFCDFGIFQDAMTTRFDFVNHAVLTPYLNSGLLTPDDVVRHALQVASSRKIPLNSLEGLIRQVIGWREFVRGIYQSYSDVQDRSNFWNHQRKLNHLWYTGQTGIPPLDHVIQKVVRLGYAHHIERLMILGSLMMILEIQPQEAHRWFMEMFIDSSDWVMGPNVYGMALFSDGGVFATKPYCCASNYYRKMGDYPTGDWQEAVDGLYWQFVERHQAYFQKNPRMTMMLKTLSKMPKEKKDRLYQKADQLKSRISNVA